jgi:hypothetical protein
MSLNRLVPLSGILAVALTVISFVIVGDTPDLDAPVTEIKSFYVTHDTDLATGGILLVLAGLFFLVFFSALRNFLRRAEPDAAGASTFSFAAGILVTVGLSIFGGIDVALGDVPDQLDPAGLQLLNVLSEDLFPPFAIGTLLFLVATGVAIIRTGTFPRWLGWAIIVGAVFGVTPLFPVAMLTLGLFTLIASVVMSMRAGEAFTRT